MKVGIIGAGASGMMAAITAAENGAKVVLIEKNERVGKKILATGNGKCNVSNLDFTPDKYYCDDKEKLQKIFSNFTVEDTINFFRKKGMLLRDKNGYLYPYSEQASTVLDFFRRLLADNKVVVENGYEVLSAHYHKDKESFIVKSETKSWEFDRLIITCGGPASLKRNDGKQGFVLAKGFGHTVKRTVPALVQLKSDESFLKAMAGVRFQARLSLLVNGKEEAQEQGEVQFTEYGISGIPVFQISRLAAYAIEEKKKVNVLVNFFPDFSDEAFFELISHRYNACIGTTLENFLNGTVNKKIHQAIMKKCGYKPEDTIKKIGFSEIKKYMLLYRSLNIHITATNGMSNAQVCAGGIPLNEITASMESLKQNGLFFAGEVVDVDGKCGGYNLQWAWTSGFIAGKNAADGK